MMSRAMSLPLGIALLCQLTRSQEAAVRGGRLPAGFPTIPMQGVRGDVPMPLYGLGTWQYNNSVAEEAVTKALAMGYRHVDTALGYKNQDGVGRGLAKSGVPREEYFVTSKIPGGLNASATAASLAQCLEQLGIEYVDLMLIHFPATWTGEGGPSMRKEQWKALEAWAKSGKARAIGVSHYCKSQLDDVLQVATVPVALNQVEYHIGMGSSGPEATDDKEYVESKGVVYMAFSTLCGPCPPPLNKELTAGPLTTGIGKAHNKTGAQVALRWAVQQGLPVIPKSNNGVHLRENMELFDFTLSEEEMAMLTQASTPPVCGGGDNKTSGDCSVKMQDALVFA